MLYTIKVDMYVLQKNVLLVLFLCVFLIGYDLLSAQSWANPPAPPPTSNTPAPVNIGTSSQVKNGTLGIDGLGLFSNTPSIIFTDETVNHRDWWLWLDNQTFSFVSDRNSNGSHSGDAPHPLQLYASTSATADWARFGGEVRANEYCNYLGADCFTPTDVVEAIETEPIIEIERIFGETWGQTTIANELCITAGYDGIWAVIDDTNGGEIIQCFNATGIQIVNENSNVSCQVRFVTKVNTQSKTVTKTVSGNGVMAIGSWWKNDEPWRDVRFTGGDIVRHNWGGSLFDSGERAGVGYYSPANYTTNITWLSTLSGVEIKTMPLIVGATESIDQVIYGRDVEISARVLSCTNN